MPKADPPPPPPPIRRSEAHLPSVLFLPRLTALEVFALWPVQHTDIHTFAARHIPPALARRLGGFRWWNPWTWRTDPARLADTLRRHAKETVFRMAYNSRFRPDEWKPDLTGFPSSFPLFPRPGARE